MSYSKKDLYSQYYYLVISAKIFTIEIAKMTKTEQAAHICPINYSLETSHKGVTSSLQKDARCICTQHKSVQHKKLDHKNKKKCIHQRLKSQQETNALLGHTPPW